MADTFKSLKRKIDAVRDGDERYDAEQLGDMIYSGYQNGKLSQDEYETLCFLVDTTF